VMRWRRCRCIVIEASCFMPRLLVVFEGGAAMLGLLAFRELLMCLEEEEESIGSCVSRVIGGIGVL
jgi:hypothetical protein